MRPDIADPAPVRRKFELYHASTTFADDREEARVWELWLLRECNYRNKRYTVHPVAVPGAFLANMPPGPDDLSADYEVIRSD